jgi:hypothetical protein
VLPGRRFAYRLCYVVTIATGRAAARLAADFRTLSAVDSRLTVVSVVLRVPVLACWFLVRTISLAAFAACSALAPAH